MTVYVDNARIPARVGHLSARWSHLITDGPLTELHVFAQGIGLRRAWFQPGRNASRPHYDVTDAKRAAALAAGAVPVSWHDVPGILSTAPGDVFVDGRRILVTGSRTWTDNTLIAHHLGRAAQLLPAAVLVHGDARGADRIAAAIWTRWRLPVEAHPADWERDGRAAGHLRNALMVRFGARLCLAFIRDHSPGATACADLAERAGIRTIRIHTGTTT